MPLPTAHIRYLEVFQLVMRTRNLTAAARLLNISQPAVSHALKELEAQLGFGLLHRGHGPLRPTAEASLLLPEVEHLFAQLGMFALRASELKDERGGHLTIATVPSLATRVLPRALAAFRSSRQRVHFKLLVQTVNDVATLVKDEVAEVAFAFSPIDQSGIINQPLLDTALVAYVSREHPLYQKAWLSPADLAGEVTIVPTEQTVPGQILRRFLDGRQLKAFDMIESNSAAAAISLVREGLGIALMDPLTTGDGLPDSVGWRRFEPTIAVTMTLLLSRHRSLSGVAAEFLRHVGTSARDEAARLTSLGIATQAYSLDALTADALASRPPDLPGDPAP